VDIERSLTVGQKTRPPSRRDTPRAQKRTDHRVIPSIMGNSAAPSNPGIIK